MVPDATSGHIEGCLIMSIEFTNKELITLFDQKVKFKKTLFFEAENFKFPVVKAGTVARICLIEDIENKKSVIIMIDGEFQAFDRSLFDYHLEVVEPCFINEDD